MQHTDDFKVVISLKVGHPYNEDKLLADLEAVLVNMDPEAAERLNAYVVAVLPIEEYERR